MGNYRERKLNICYLIRYRARIDQCHLPGPFLWSVFTITLCPLKFSSILRISLNLIPWFGFSQLSFVRGSKGLEYLEISFGNELERPPAEESYAKSGRYFQKHLGVCDSNEGPC